MSHLITILDWICRFDPRRGSNSVINISLCQLAYNDPNNAAISAAIATTVDTYHIPVVLAAGNFSGNVWWYEPANAGRGITVGGLNQAADTRWQYSNYGNTTAFYAPAQYVQAASTSLRSIEPALDHDLVRSELNYPTINTQHSCTDPGYFDTCTSGTSFSAPHMTGVVARYLQAHPGALRDNIVAFLQAQSSQNTATRVYEPETGAYVPILAYNACP